MSEFRPLAKFFYWATVISAAIILVSFGRVLQFPSDLAAQTVFALLIVAHVFADFSRIHLRSRISLTIGTAIDFAAMLLFGPALAAVVGVTGNVISDLWLKKAWYKLLFNASNALLSISASGLIYRMLSDGNNVPLHSVENALVLVLAGVAYLVVNTGTVGTMIGLIEGHHPFDFIKSTYRGLIFQLITLIPLGTLLSLIYYQNPWGLGLLLFPILLTRLSFENYDKLLAESRRTIELLADAVDKRDRYTSQHSQRVSVYAEKVARRMGMDMTDVETINFAARIHDLGKIGTPSSVLFKEGKLTPEERQIMEQHAAIGAHILSQLTSYESVRNLIAHHHERVDGKGYPLGVKATEIPIGARILAVADSFEAMTSDRPYRKALSLEAAMAELERGRGTQFDSDILDHFLRVLAEEKQAWQVGVGVDLQVLRPEG